MKPASVLFVCLGNICRSPMAEGVFRKMVTDAGLQDMIRIDSAGTGDWHIGEPPDRRAIEEAAKHGVDITGLRARLVRPADFRTFDHVLAMDHSNLAALQRLAPPSAVKPALFLRYAAGLGRDEVPDPYRVGGFDKVFGMIEAGAAGLLHALSKSESGAQ